MNPPKTWGKVSGRTKVVARAMDNTPTPHAFYDELNEEFHFDHDPCPINPDGLRSTDGLGNDWGKRTFVNPPYSDKMPWIKRAIEEQKKGNLVVMLLPVDTSTSWFQDYVLPNATIRWVRGRLKLDNGKHPAYASMLAIFTTLKPKAESKEK